MPASHERIANRPLSGQELKEIILKDVARTLDRDGMFIQNIAYSRVSYEVRTTLHLDIMTMPEHISTTLSKAASKQESDAKPELKSIEAGPTLNNPSDDDVVDSVEVHREINSPNGARVEHDMPLPLGKIDVESGKEKTITYEGDKPDPESMGNRSSIEDKSDEEAKKRGRSKAKAPAPKKAKWTP